MPSLSFFTHAYPRLAQRIAKLNRMEGSDELLAAEPPSDDSPKHRLARSSFLFALRNGWIGRDTCVVEAS